MRITRAAAFGLALSFLVSAPLFAAPAAKSKGATTGPVAKIDPQSIDIPYKKFTLDNGLTLLVHEDRKAPIVAVNVWYHVGSKNEPDGRSGFAHLFEHLMFNGSENFDQDYFQALERIGATDLNGTTNEDRTNYFQNVPPASATPASSTSRGSIAGGPASTWAITKSAKRRGLMRNADRRARGAARNERGRSLIPDP